MEGDMSSPITSNPSSMSSNTKNYSKILLPNYEKIKFDPDTDPQGFRQWAKRFSDISVANFGEPARALIHFIDRKTGRKSLRREQTMLQTVPEIYLAPGLAPKSHSYREVLQGSRLGTSTATDAQGPPAGDGSVSFGTPTPPVMGSPISGASHDAPYYEDAADFTPEMEELNNYLYIALSNSYVGSKGTRLPEVPEPYCLFHYAMIYLWNMDKKNIASRKIRAVEAFGQVQFQGDAMKFKYDLLDTIREIFVTEYSLNDFIYQGVIDKLKNKDPQTLVLLTDQLNLLNASADPSAPQNWETNLTPIIDYLITTKAVLGNGAAVQAVRSGNAGKKAPINKATATEPPPGMTWSTEPADPACTDMSCGNCKQPNHHRRKNCPMGHLDTGPTCGYCSNKGHTTEMCNKKTRDEKGGFPNLNKPSPTNPVSAATERAELLGKLASLDAQAKPSPAYYVRGKDEVTRLPDSGPVLLPLALRSLYQSYTNSNMAPDRPSHVRTQEGHCDSDPQLASETSEGRRLEDDARRLLELTHERQPKEIDIPEASAKFEPSVFSTEKVRYFDSDLQASEAFEDQRLEDDSLRLVELTHGRQPKEIDIPEGSAKFEPSTLSTEERRNTVAEPLSQVDNPDDAHEECGNPLLQFIRGFEGALHAHKGPLPTLPSTTGLEERREDMVKMNSQKGNSSRDFPTNDDVAQPVHGGAPDLNNIIKEVATPSTDGQGPPPGPWTSSDKILQTVMSSENAMEDAPICNGGDSVPDKGTQLVVLGFCDGIVHAHLQVDEATSLQGSAGELHSPQVSTQSTLTAKASHANPKTDYVPGVDHPLASDINDITEEDIAAVPRNFIKHFVCVPEYADFSKLSLPPSETLVQQQKQQARDSGEKHTLYSFPRKGLEGEKDKTFRTCIQIWEWVKKHHPDCIYLSENMVSDRHGK